MIERTELWLEGFRGGAERMREAVCAPSTIEYPVRAAVLRRLAEYYDCPTLALQPLQEAAERIASLGAAGDASSERERLASEFAERFALSHRAIDEAHFEELRTVFSDAEIVELAGFVHTFEGAFKTTVIFRTSPSA